MSEKTKVGLVFGGRSAEHEVSLMSAKNVAHAIDREKYEIVPIAITKDGEWFLSGTQEFLLHPDEPSRIALNMNGMRPIAVAPGSPGGIINIAGERIAIDVAFPILHGPFGEDGTVQGLLKLTGIPFVGADVLGSAIGMDKDVMKRLLRDANMPIARFRALGRNDEADFNTIASALGLPFFVKPANLGSSVGVSKVKEPNDFLQAIEGAFKHDSKILVEEYIKGRELECAVLGNEEAQASGVGEVVPHREFYSYEAKYIDQNGAGLVIPADISPEVRERIRELAVRTFRTLSCAGLGRVDFFLKEDGSVFVNEINTIPGFTSISMYPKLWAEEGIEYPALVERLLDLAFQRQERSR